MRTTNEPFSGYAMATNAHAGDFSFTLSLKRHHKIRQLTTTCYDSKDTLENKYPGVRTTLNQLLPSTSAPPYESQTLNRLGDQSESEAEWRGFSPSPPGSYMTEPDEDRGQHSERPRVTVLYGIDATRLSSAHRKALRPHSPFTKIVFNFPHVGGLSTDVNRQVRYNQELLVGFFHAAKPLLSSPRRPARIQSWMEHDTREDDDVSDGSERGDVSNPGAVNGQLLVTLFEGEPYTLWNIRDLARHCGLKVVESFKFPWSAYPGYQHARTIGDITSGKDRSDEGKRKGAWRGEEREARCYVLEDQDAEPPSWPSHRKKRKQEGDDEDDDVSD